MRTLGFFIWSTIQKKFGPNQPSDKIRLRAEWMAYNDHGVTFAEFALEWERLVTALVASGIGPTDAEQEAVLLTAVNNPKIRDILQDTLVESVLVPIPDPRIHTIASFWAKSVATATLFTEIGNWGVENKAMYSNVEDTSNSGGGKSKHPNGKKGFGTTKGAGTGVGNTGNSGKGYSSTKGTISNGNSKYGPKSDKKRPREPLDNSQLRCYRCGRHGHVTNDKLTGKLCAHEKCSMCNGHIGRERHDSRTCTDKGPSTKRARS